MLKPTAEMESAISRAGFASGQQAVQILGFGGALRKLTTDSAGATLPLDELEKRFGRIQGLLGVLAGVGSDQYIQKLKEISAAEEGLTKIKAGEILSSDAQVALQGWTKFKNFMTDEVGGALLHVAANDLKFFFPADDSKKNAEKALDDAFKGPELQFKNQEAFNKRRLANQQQFVEEFGKEYNLDLLNAKQANDSLTKDTESTVQRIITTRQHYIAELGKQSEHAREIARDSAGRVLDLERGISDRRFKSAISDRSPADQSAATLTRAIVDANQAASDLEKAGRSGDQHGIGRAEALFSHANQEAQTALEIAKQAKDKDGIANAQARINQLAQTQISAEQTLQRHQEARAQALAAEQARQEKLLNSIKDQARIVVANSVVTNKQGKLLPDDQLAQLDKKRQSALDQIAKLGFGSKDLNLANTLGLTKFVTEHRDALQGQPARLRFDVEGGIEKIKTDVVNAFKTFTVKINAVVDVDKLSKDSGQRLKSPADVTSALASQSAKTTETSFSQLQADKLSQKIVSDLNLADSNTRAARDTARNLNGANYPASVDSLLNSIKSAITDAAKGGNVSSGQLQTIETLLKRVEGTTQPTGGARYPTGGEKQLKDAEGSAFNQLKELKELQSLAPSKVTLEGSIAPDTSQILSTDRQILEELKKGGASRGGASAAAGKLDSALQAPDGAAANLAGALSTASSAADGAAAQLSSIHAPPGATVTTLANPVSSSGGSYSPFSAKAEYLKTLQSQSDRSNFDNYKEYHGLSTGGLVSYFADGGYAKGTDTVPAMLTPGEFVVNANSAGKFYSQLQAINAGDDPSPTINGGDVHNYGGFNIHAARDAKDTARAVIDAIRREQRRGSGNSLN